VHSTIFIKDSIDFNENLATFIGDRGTENFLISTYGKESKEYKDYIELDIDFARYSNHMLRGTEKLDSLYKTMKESDSVDLKRQLKKETIQKIVYALDTLTLLKHQKPSERFRERLPNNTYFINMKRYQEKQDTFWEEYNSTFNGDLKYFIKHLSEKHPFL
jgi:predicted aminopeptidase